MPFLAGLIICVFATAIFIQALLDKSSVGEKIWAHLKFRKLVFTILMLTAYAFLIKPIGFLIGTFFLILLLSRYMGYQTWVRSVLLAFSSSILSYLLFEMWLKAQLPRGIIGF